MSATNETKFQKLVFHACTRVPRGKVTTYHALAQAISRPKASRAVGNALNKNKNPKVPCHRVVKSDGTIGGFAHGTKRKAKMLGKEGVRVENNKIDLGKFVYSFK